ncbi:hypothetical protein N7533_011924 [Penicillium manginii]|uniref:uncharacterized protein n=1 Tax=Penicillium manginii TaxID=203109 RepID=UPI0025490A09|nr:uncharacterized protein N7533_011924 [Penicillium manginii]KAJ5739140.1 hypothetical protein N7533_011924 [Penicillium manginii]
MNQVGMAQAQEEQRTEERRRHSQAALMHDHRQIDHRAQYWIPDYEEQIPLAALFADGHAQSGDASLNLDTPSLRPEN